MLPLFKALVFDLDGTLIDTIHDLADSVNEVLKSRNLPPHSVESYKFRVGDGIKLLLKRSLPEEYQHDEVFLEHITSDFNDSYHKHWKNYTKPYSGILPLLHSLQDLEIKMAILSNKPQRFTDLCAEHFFPGIHFNSVFGANANFPKKPDPSSANHIATQMSVLPGEVMYVGDTSIDMNTAINAGMYPVGVSWGFRSIEELFGAGAKIILNYPEELLLMVSKQA
jgi:phosphoglycolate phosphatase